MKIAIIGGGVSGNTVAYSLYRDHEVTLFEASDYLGGHTHTHEISWQGKHYNIDTGFIVFNDRTYPNFLRLLKAINIEKQPTEMSFSVTNQESGLEYNGHSLDTLFAQRNNIFKTDFHRMLWNILRFNRESRKLLSSGDSNISLGDYLRKEGYSKSFIENYIVPMGAAIWSTDPQTMNEVPATFFIRFFEHHGLLNIKNRPQWYVIKNGSKCYVDAMSAGYQSRIRLSSPVESVQRTAEGVWVKPRNAESEHYDAVFFATHSDQALKILGQNASHREKQVLSSIGYQENEAVLHTDTRLLPTNRKAWASWNYNVGDSGQQGAAVTYHMNKLQGINAPVDFCVTLNSTQRIDPGQVIKKMTYHHPVFTPDAVSAQQCQHELDRDRTFFCGAYWRNGFHEDGVVSALNAVKHFKEQFNEKLHLPRAG